MIKRMTSRSTCLVFLLIQVTLFGVDTTFSQSGGVPDKCTQVLLEKNVSLLETYDYSKVIYMYSFDEEKFNQAKQRATASVAGYFSGSWSSFQEERRKLAEKIFYSATTEQSRSALTSVSLPGATEAWLGCINETSEASAFFGNITGDPKGKRFVVDVTWKPAYGVGEPPIKIVRSSIAGLNRGKILPAGKIGYEIQRSTADEDILLTVTGKSGTLNRSFIVFLPAYKPPPPVPVSVVLGSCIGRGGVQGVRLWGPVGEICAGAPAWNERYLVDTTIPTPKKIGSCRGRGGLEGVTLWGPEGQPCGGIPVWGTYGSHAGPPVDISALTLCGCVGPTRAGFEGLVFWGPSGQPCGGISAPGWGRHEQYCVPRR